MGIIEKMRLDGKKGFVTGAARGIGKCTATAFAEAGADVAIIDMDIAAAEATAGEIAGATGRRVIALKCDVTDEAQVQAMVDNVEETMEKAGYMVKHVEGSRGSNWILMDFGDVIVHIFDEENRLFYDLERIWRDGVLVDAKEFMKEDQQ